MRFQYGSLTGDQFRIALGLLNVKESDVTGALEAAVGKVVDEAVRTALATFGVVEGGMPTGGVTAAPAKSRPRARRKKNVVAVTIPVVSPIHLRPAKTRAGGKKGRRTTDITPEQLASRQLQGRYLGAIRRVPASKRSKYQKIANDIVAGGRAEAIKQINIAYPK